MKAFLTILFIISFQSLLSQRLIPDAAKVKSAFEMLVVDTSNKALQRSYVDSFPSNTKSFLNVFQTKHFDQLYNESYNYLDQFEKCGNAYPKEVLGKCINIGKNLVWDADAVGQLQQISVKLSAEYPEIFINDYKTLSAKDQNGLVNFYADVENFNEYPEFQELINKLNLMSQSVISSKLESARKKRKMSKDH
jgi:hypothetical protein